MPDGRRMPTVGDRLEDAEGDVWTVTEVIAHEPHPYVILERVVVSTRAIRGDIIGPHCQYRPIIGPAQGAPGGE